MAGNPRFEQPAVGDLYRVVRRKRHGDISQSRSVVGSVDRAGGGVVVELEGGRLRYPTDGDRYGEYTDPGGREWEAYAGKVVVPASQVAHPGVAPGDTVKLGTGSVAYRVEAVDNGIVSLEDGRSVPVTQITAFDEDVDDYDPFKIIPGDISDLFGGGG